MHAVLTRNIQDYIAHREISIAPRRRLRDHLVKKLNQLVGDIWSTGSIVLYGSGASTTHLPKNLPTLVAGGANIGLQHGHYWRNGDTQMSDVFLSILHSMGIQEERFADSAQTGAREVFTKA